MSSHAQKKLSQTRRVFGLRLQPTKTKIALTRTVKMVGPVPASQKKDNIVFVMSASLVSPAKEVINIVVPLYFFRQYFVSQIKVSRNKNA